VFKRLLAPSPATERLAEIAYHVTLNHKSEEKAQKKRDKWRQIPAFLVAIMRPSIRKEQNERDGRRVDDRSSSACTTSKSDTENLYEPLPFVPLQTERETEDVSLSRSGIFHPIPPLCSFLLCLLSTRMDSMASSKPQYGAVCAAVQNVLLSLHAESLATKWATGKVIHTQAFRQLVGATDPRDRIVALIMIGLPIMPGKEEDNDDDDVAVPSQKPQRFRRDWKDFLQDVS